MKGKKESFMLGLVGFIKKKLELDGKLPDKWKETGKDEPAAGTGELKVSEDFSTATIPAGTYNAFSASNGEKKVVTYAEPKELSLALTLNEVMGPLYIVEDEYLNYSISDYPVEGYDLDALGITKLGYFLAEVDDEGKIHSLTWSATQPA